MIKLIIKQLKIMKPFIIEIIMFITYFLSVGVVNSMIWWQCISFGYLLILIALLFRITKTYPKGYVRIRSHIILNLIFLTFFLISMLCFSGEVILDIYAITLLLNCFMQIEYMIYYSLSLNRTKLSYIQTNISSFMISVILFGVVSLIVWISKDKWLIIGLLGAFINHILNEKRLLSFKYKSDSEIDEVVERYRLKQKFWIVKGIGLAFILSWGASIFLFKHCNQGLVIVSGMYLCVFVSALICFLFNKFLTEELNRTQK